MDCIHKDKCLYVAIDKKNCEGCKYYKSINSAK